MHLNSTQSSWLLQDYSYFKISMKQISLGLFPVAFWVLCVAFIESCMAQIPTMFCTTAAESS